MRADLGKTPGQVAAMFDAVASRYDWTNDVLSVWQDRGWRRATLAALDLVPGERVLDLAGGTGTAAAALADVGAEVVCADFSIGMLERAARRNLPISLVGADAAALPFADAAFDAVTMSFGLRNVADVPAVLRELKRVTRPRGRLVICEFSQPPNLVLRGAYHLYLDHILPRLARRVAANPEAYLYLSQSIKAWPNQPALTDLIAQAGWSRIAHRNLSGGIVALHRAIG